MRALVPLGEKSSESVPERVLPYRHLLEKYIYRQIKIFPTQAGDWKKLSNNKYVNPL